MTLNDISSIANLLAAIGVLITLIYLSRQVRQGNMLAKYQARQRMVEQAQEELYRWGDSPSLRESFVKKEPEFRARARGGRQSGASVLIPHSSPRSTSLITRPPTTYFEEIRRFDTPAPNSVMAA